MTTVTIPNLALLRVLAGTSQRSLARQSGVGYQTIRRIEAGDNAGQLQLLTLQKIATALTVSLAELLAGSIFQPQPIECASPLNLSDYRLLKKIEQGQTTTATLTNEQRRISLPRLVSCGLVTVAQATVGLSQVARAGLDVKGASI